MTIREQLVDLLGEVTSYLKTADLQSPTFVEEMEAAFPFEGDRAAAVRRLALEGLERGEICNMGEGEVTFSRISKPSDRTAYFSIDAVHMRGEGPEHTHPKGEVSFCIATEGEPEFDGFKPGWAICRPGSTHVPTVTGGRMLILYFLPEGSVIWKKP